MRFSILAKSLFHLMEWNIILMLNIFQLVQCSNLQLININLRNADSKASLRIFFLLKIRFVVQALKCDKMERFSFNKCQITIFH